MNLRATAASLLAELIRDGKSLNTLIPKAQQHISTQDQGLLQEIVFGCCRWFFFLDGIVSTKLNRPLPQNAIVARALLVVGAYQLVFLRVPTHAAINETVEASKQLGESKKSGMINAVLRSVTNDLPITFDESTTKQSFPPWFLAKLSANWPEQTPEILHASNLRPPMFLRVNVQKTSREAYLAKLASDGINATGCDHSLFGIRLEKPMDVDALPDFKNGFVSVQDEAAQLCTTLLDIKEDMHILDACAAPGGKTCAILEQYPSSQLVALDQDASRLKRVQENLDRIGLSARLKCAEAQNVSDWHDGEEFDRILLDAPCSATGVIRRHPDIKLLRKAEDLKNLAELQLHLLKSVWKTLKVKGKLVYATCSVFPQENARIIERFLASENGAELSKIDALWGEETGFGRQLFPLENGHDGFFYSVLYKKH